MSLFDFTGISTEGSGVQLAPGRYKVSTNDNWTVTKTDSGNMSLRIPFTVLESGEYEGGTASMYHTIMLPPEGYSSMSDKEKAEIADKIRYNKQLTLQLFANLGLINEETDRDQNTGALHADFEYGEKDDYDRVPVNCLKVTTPNGEERRSLGGRIAIAVVVTSSYTKSGVKVDRFDPAGDAKQQAQQPQPQQVQPEQQPQQQPQKPNAIPF